MDLHEMTAESLLDAWAKRQGAAIDAEAEEARAKARWEAVQGAVMEDLKRAGHPVEIAKKLMWGEPVAQKAHEEYLEVWVASRLAKASQERAKEALSLWQTVRSDLRGKV